VLSSATQLVEIIPGSSRTRFRDRPETVRLHRGIGVHLHPGILFGFIPECHSDSSRNRVHLRPDSHQEFFSEIEAFATSMAKRPAEPNWYQVQEVANAAFEQLPDVTRFE
jgi:hypothetical protein